MRQRCIQALAILFGMAGTTTTHAYSIFWHPVHETEVEIDLLTRGATGGLMSFQQAWTGDGSELPYSRSHQLASAIGHADGEGTAESHHTQALVEIEGAPSARETHAYAQTRVAQKFRIDGDPGSVDVKINYEWSWDYTEVSQDDGLFRTVSMSIGVPDASARGPAGGTLHRQPIFNSNVQGTGTGWLQISLLTGVDYTLAMGSAAYFEAQAPDQQNGPWPDDFSQYASTGLRMTGFDLPGAPVPEPASLALLGAGLAGAVVASRRRKRSPEA